MVSLPEPEEADLPASPCIRMCCLDDRSDVCLGCFRSLAEITGWRAANAQERACILANCAARKKEHAARTPGATR